MKVTTVGLQRHGGLSVLIAAASLAFGALPARAVDLERQVSFTIPSQSLSSALMLFAEQTKIQVITASSDLGGYQTRGAQGQLRVRDALASILAGTGLTFQEVGNRTVTIRREGQTEPTSTGSRQSHGNSIQLAQTGALQAVNASSAGREGREGGDQEPAAAEDSANVSQREIVVTAQKREQNIRDVPVSITAMSGKALEEAGISNALDLSFAVPSMAVMEQQPGRQMIVIRGMGSERGGSGLTGVYLDEIPLTSTTAGTENTVDLRAGDLQRVEVLKGPQGTLFGEGSVGGTVRFITNDPRLDRVEGKVGASSSFTHDGSPSYGFNGVLNVPVVENVLGLRVAGFYENRGGWIDMVPGQGQPVVKEDINDNETREIRVKGLWTPTDKLSISALVSVHRTEGGAGNFVNVDPVSDSNYQPGFSVDLPQEALNEYEIYNLTATYDLGFAELLSSTSRSQVKTTFSYSQVFEGNLTAASFVGLAVEPVLTEIASSDNLADSSAFSQELRLTSAGSGPFKWTVGGFYKDSESETSNGILSVRVGGLPWFSLTNGVPNTFTSEAWAGFADASFAVTDRLEIGAGIRHVEEERGTYLTSAGAASGIFADFTKLTYRVFSSYKINDQVKLYINTSTGFRAGGLNSQTSGVPRTFEPEEVKAYEVGAKTSFMNGRVRADIAFFRSDYVDKQEDAQLLIAGQVQQYTSNVGEARIEGVEWAVDWLVTDRWSLSLNGDVTDAEVTKIDASRPNPIAVPGDPLNFVPEYSFSVSSGYDFVGVRSLPSHFRLDYNVQGGSTDIFRGGIGFIPVHTAPVVRFLNANLTVEWNEWELSLFGRNVLNEAEIIRPGNTDINVQARPRTFGIGVSRAF